MEVEKIQDLSGGDRGAELPEGKDYQLQECLGMGVRPGRAIQQNKIPVIELLSIARDNGDRAGTESEIRREGNNCTGHRLHAVMNV